MAPRDPELAPGLAHEVEVLFAQHGLPGPDPAAGAGACDRIAMVSTHGYWSDPPPAGATDTGGQTLYVLELSKQCARAGRRVVILVRWFAPDLVVGGPDEPGHRVMDFHHGAHTYGTADGGRATRTLPGPGAYLTRRAGQLSPARAPARGRARR